MNLKNLIPLPAVALAALVCVPVAGLAQTILNTAANFALLGGTAITSTGTVGTNIVKGNVGLSPGATSGITGFPPAVLTGGGAIIATGAVTAQARLDLITASVALAGMPSNVNMSNVNLGGTTLAPGVYTFNGAAALTGALVLDAQGKNNVSWVFQIGTSLTTAINSSVTFINLGSNGGSDLGLFWNAGSAINVGGNNQIAGNYLAGTSITFGGITSGGGRALALAGISLDNNTVNSGGGPGSGGLAGGLIFNASGDAVPATTSVVGGIAVPGGTVNPSGVVVPAGTIVAGATSGSSGSVLLSLSGAYTPGVSSLILIPGTATYATVLTVDGNVANGLTPASLRVTAATATLTGTNTYTGGTYVDAGALVTGSANLPTNQAVSITNGSQLVFNQTTAGTFGGVISGSGSLSKLGTGALTIVGNNTYSGGTFVNAGTLIASSSALPAAGNVTVASGSTLVFNQATDGVYAGNITGSGTVQKTGAKSLTLSNSTSSAFALQAGALYLNGGIGATTISPGALLGGNGTVTGNLVNNGTVSPGYSPGTINVVGNYTQGAAGVLVIQLASGTSFDKLVVTGSASLAGTLQVDVLNGFNPLGQTFTFLTATSGVTGTFTTLNGTATVTSNPSLFAAVTYAANSVSFVIAQGSFANLALTPNQAAVAAAAQNVPGQTAALNVLPLASQFPTALNAISPQGYQVWSDFAFANATSLADTLMRENLAVMGHDEYYFQGSQRRGRSHANLDVGTSNYVSSAGLVGGNHALDANITLGAYAAFGKTTSGLGSVGSSTTVKEKTIGARAGWADGPLFAEAMLAYGFNRYETTRPIVFPGTAAAATSYTHGHQWTTGFTVGEHFNAGVVTVSPFGGLLWSRWSANHFTEQGAGAYNATIGSQTAHSLRSQLGTEARMKFGIVQPHVRVAWLHEYSNGSRDINASFGNVNYAVATRRPSRNSMLYTAGVDLAIAPNALIYADLDSQSDGATRVISEWRLGVALTF